MTKNIFKFEAMTTPCEVIIFLQNKELAKDIAQEVLQNTKKLEQKYNYFDNNSFISKINLRQIQIIDFQTKELLQKAKMFYMLTNKSFDVTIATIKHLYKLPNLTQFEFEKERLSPYLGCEHFSVKKNKIIFDNEFTKIDFGGIVKEFAVDEAVKILQKRKVNSGIINFGGDLFAIGKKPNGEKFKIGIKNPRNPIQNIAFVEICDEALTTSANYERNYKIENKIFSHIIDTKQNTNDIISATIISQNTMISGAYSTSLMIDEQIKTKYKTIKIKQNMEVIYENFSS